MRIRVGTSGFSYKPWKGPFYPKDLPESKMLRFYADTFDAVEINGTFYRMPKPDVFTGWTKEVGKDFSFVVKAPMVLSHLGRGELLRDPALAFFAAIKAFGKRLGPVLLQLPKYLKKDLALLAAFFAFVPRSTRIALDVADPSWLDDDVHAFLRKRNAALVVVDDPKRTTSFTATAPWGYLRLRATKYDDRALAAWTRRIRGAGWEDAWVFFKHDDEATGPSLGKRLKRVVEGGA